MARPLKDPAERVRQANLTFTPAILATLAKLMREDRLDNRSAMLSNLIAAEAARRERAKKRALHK